MWRPSGTAIGIGAAVLVGVFTVRLLARSRKRKKITGVIEMIPELQRPNVFIKDKERVEDIVCQLIRGGSQKLQVVSDFDMTMSRYHRNGERCLSAHSAIDASERLPIEYKTKCNALFDKYYKIEHDQTLSFQEKLPFMEQWWTEGHAALIKAQFKQSDVSEIAKEGRTVLRDGCDLFLEMLYANGVPLLIFSAGLGDMLEELIKQQAKLHSNIKVVSNYIDFDENGISRAFKGKMIHICNKNSTVVEEMHKGYIQEHSHRENIILLGDSEGDLAMVDGMKAANVLRIGFLNANIEGLLPTYMEIFDIVLVDDQTLDVANSLLRKIFYLS